MWFTEADVKHSKSALLRTITNINQEYGKVKEDFLHSCISKILFINTERFSKIQFFFTGFFQEFS